MEGSGGEKSRPLPGISRRQSDVQKVGQIHATDYLFVLTRQGTYVPKQASFLLDKLAFVLLSDQEGFCCI